MSAIPNGLRRSAGKILAVVLVLGAYGFTRLPHLGDQERAGLAGRFHFSASELPDLKQFEHHTVRKVSPALDHISAWISSVGASVALNDLDGDGLPNDVCWVDVRVDKAIVAPAPGTGERYAPVVLDASPLRYDRTMAPMGCLPGDLNEDGRMDLLVYYWGRSPIAYLRKSDGGYRPQEIYPGEERWFTEAATFADVDGDGHPDLIVGNYFPDGNRVLDPESKDKEAMQHSMSRAFNAGKNRLLLWAGGTVGDQPSVTYREAPEAFDDEVTHGWTLAVGAADLDGDLLPEIYFGNDFGPDRLLHNRSTPGHPAFARLEGERDFFTPASCVIGRDSFKGMGADFGDVNGDGLLDIYVSNIATEFGLQESHFLWLSTGDLAGMKQGRAPYVHGSEKLGLARSGWGWDTRLDDFDNDGVLEAVQATGFVKGEVNRWPELQALGTSNDEVLKDPRFWPKFQPGADLSGHEPNAFFVRAGDGRYYNLAEDLGLGEPVVSRGIATADVDGDGDLDFAFANQWAPSVFYRNECPQCGGFVGLHLLLPITGGEGETRVVEGHPSGVIAARPAVGAGAVLHLPDGRRLVAQVDGGNGHSGSRSQDLHFGLGATPMDAPLALELSWRDGDGQAHRQTFELTAGWHTLYLGNTTPRS
jgi:hypothetical protein